MKTYPSIDFQPSYTGTLYVFDKYDGSNMRAEWTRKNGFHKFGRRKALLDDSNPVLLEFPDLLMDNWAVDLAAVFKSMRLQKATAFFEFWGDNSFAGSHQDEEHHCTLLDVSPHPKGIMEPKDFIKKFEGLPHATLLHKGGFNRSMEQEVRDGTFEGVTFEGVVVKGPHKSPGRPLMFKVKSQDWLDKLKGHCGDDAALFEKMK